MENPNNETFQEIPTLELENPEVVEGELLDDAIESFDMVDGEIVKTEPLSPIESTRIALEHLDRAKEQAGIEPAPLREKVGRSAEAQAELDNWESLSVTLPHETREKIMAKAQEIKDPGMRRRTERYAEANWLYEQSDKLNHQAEKAQAHGNNITATKMYIRAKELYARGTDEYTLADREYKTYQEKQKSPGLETPKPAKKSLFSKVGSWFKK